MSSRTVSGRQLFRRSLISISGWKLRETNYPPWMNYPPRILADKQPESTRMQPLRATL